MPKKIWNRLFGETAKIPAAYYTRAIALTRDFGDGGIYEEHHSCSLEPDADGKFNVFARVANITGDGRMKDFEPRLLAQKLPAQEAIALARKFIEDYEKTRPIGSGPGEIMPAAGAPPQDYRGPYQWQHISDLEPRRPAASWIPGPMDP